MHLGHCHVECRHSISALQRQHFSTSDIGVSLGREPDGLGLARVSDRADARHAHERAAGAGESHVVADPGDLKDRALKLNEQVRSATVTLLSERSLIGPVALTVAPVGPPPMKIVPKL